MDRLLLPFAVALVVVGLVLTGIWARQRAVLNPLTARALRRVGLIGAASGGLLLVASVGLAVTTRDVFWLFCSAYAVLMLAHGLHMAHTHRPVG